MICKSIDALTREIRKIREIEERREAGRAAEQYGAEPEPGSAAGQSPPPF